MSNEESTKIEITRIINSNKQRPARFFGPVSEEKIAQAEGQLEVLFPSSYRAFLKHFGAAFLFGYEILGITDEDPFGDEPPYWGNVVAASRLVKMPKHLVKIMDDEGDYTFFLDTRTLDSEGECPVVVWGPGAERQKVAHNFLDFLRKLSSDHPLF